MVYFLETHNLYDTRIFRLRRDLSWRESHDGEPLYDDDFVTLKPSKVIAFQHQEVKIKNHLETFGTKHEAPHPNDTKLYFRAMVKRSVFPKIPSREQLVSVLKQGDDRGANSLLLNVFGFFELRDGYSFDIDDPSVIVRFETFAAENDYVGESASKDNSHVDTHYGLALQYWLVHLETGVTNFRSVDEDIRLSQADVVKKLEQMEKEFDARMIRYNDDQIDFSFYSFVPYDPETVDIE